MFFVYILRCADHTFYVGQTDDLKSRTALQNAGFASSYTALRRPVVMVYSEEFVTREAALARARDLKRWSGKKKEALVAGDIAALKSLSKRHRR